MRKPPHPWGPDVYQAKAIATRKRRDAYDKKLKLEFAERRRLLQEKLDAIVAAKKGLSHDTPN